MSLFVSSGEWLTTSAVAGVCGAVLGIFVIAFSRADEAAPSPSFRWKLAFAANALVGIAMSLSLGSFATHGADLIGQRHAALALPYVLLTWLGIPFVAAFGLMLSWRLYQLERTSPAAIAATAWVWYPMLCLVILQIVRVS